MPPASQMMSPTSKRVLPAHRIQLKAKHRRKKSEPRKITRLNDQSEKITYRPPKKNRQTLCFTRCPLGPLRTKPTTLFLRLSEVLKGFNPSTFLHFFLPLRSSKRYPPTPTHTPARIEEMEAWVVGEHGEMSQPARLDVG
jgi:hypothetical protein